MTIKHTPATDKAKRTLLAVEIPRDELAVRIAQGSLGMRIQKGVGATYALARLARTNPDMVEGYRRAADEAVLYFNECVNAASQTS